MSFNIGDLVAKVKLDITQLKAGIETAKTNTKKLTTSTDKLTDGLKKMAKQALIAFGAYQIGTKAIQFLKSSVQAANEYQKAMITLEIISSKFGVSADDAKASAERLGKELRIGVGPAAESIQNLLKSGLNLEQSIDLMKRFTNEAMTGKSSNISLAQAVENLSFAYATNNSALGNMSGISENWMDIIKKGKEALVEEGVALEDISDEQAKYRGLIDLTNLTMGSAEKFTGTLIDKQAELSIKMNDLKLLIGNGLNPVLSKLVDFMAKVVDKVMIAIEWLGEHKDIIASVATAITVLLLPALWGWGKAMAVIATETVIAMAPIVLLGILIAGLAYLVITNIDVITEWFTKLKDGIVGFFDLIINGNYSRKFGQALGLYEDSPLVTAILNLRKAFIRLKNGIVGFFDLIIKGDYTRKFGLALGLYEDSPLIIAILKLRKAFIAFGEFFVWWWDNLLHPILELLKAIFLRIFYEIFTRVQEWLNFHISVWIARFNDLWNFIEPFIIKLGELFNSLKTWIQGHIDNLMIFLRGAWEGILGFFGNIGSKIKDALVKPFTDAKEKIEEIGRKIKEAAEQINPFHRESPSLVDNVKKGLQIIRNEYDNLGTGIQMQGVSGLAGVGVGGIVINMSGNIGSVGEAQNIGIAMGDQIIGKLKQNLRF